MQASPSARPTPPPVATRVEKVRQHGFTAIELMVVVAILAILAALAGPSFTPLIERWRVRSATESLVSSLYFARSEAIKRGGNVAIDSGTGWNKGWKVTHTQGAVTTDLQIIDAPSKLDLTQSNNATKLFVDRWGMLSEASGGASTTMSFLLKPSGKIDTDASAIRLCITSGGRILQKAKGASCPA